MAFVGNDSANAALGVVHVSFVPGNDVDVQVEDPNKGDEEEREKGSEGWGVEELGRRLDSLKKWIGIGKSTFTYCF